MVPGSWQLRVRALVTCGCSGACLVLGAPQGSSQQLPPGGTTTWEIHGPEEIVTFVLFDPRATGVSAPAGLRFLPAREVGMPEVQEHLEQRPDHAEWAFSFVEITRSNAFLIDGREPALPENGGIALWFAPVDSSQLAQEIPKDRFDAIIAPSSGAVLGLGIWVPDREYVAYMRARGHHAEYGMVTLVKESDGSFHGEARLDDLVLRCSALPHGDVREDPEAGTQVLLAPEETVVNAVVVSGANARHTQCTAEWSKEGRHPLSSGVFVGPTYFTTYGTPLRGSAYPLRETAQEERADLVEGVVYTTLRPPNLDVYLFEDGKDSPRPLTRDVALDYNAVFSPDGRWVVFTSERAGNADLYALDTEEEGEPLVPITRNAALDDAACFSPDGERLAFVSTRGGDADVFVMPFAPGDPSAESRAVNLTRRPGGDFQPAFSPDGDRIAYSRQGVRWSSWSPDRPVFDISIVDLCVMDADGSNARQVSRRAEGLEMEPGTTYGSVAGSPVWVDDQHLCYYSVTSAGREIRRMRIDGSEDALVVSEGLSPALAPGGRIAFSRPQPREGMDAADLLGTGRIFSVTTRGSEIRAESDETRAYFAPHFDLRGGRMVAHGPATTEGHVGDLGEGYLFAPPDARSVVRLSDRTLMVQGVHGFFPALGPEGDVISTILGSAGEVSLSRCAPDGSGLATLFESEAGIPWGVAVAREARWLVVAVGPLFAPGEAEVDVWRMELDGSDATNLTADLSGNHALPHVSADGGRIAFRTGGDGGGRVYAMGPDGAGRRRLTEEDAVETMPALTSDGEWVVFSTDRAAGRKLWIQRADGTEGRYLEPERLDIPDTNMHVRFSPDDAWVVFTSDRGGYNDEWPLTPRPQPYGDLWAVPVAGGPAVRLTHDKWEDGPCDWGGLRVAR